ncbi:MAG: LysM peptidoglycan-binding domain-containing protein, partial [Nitrospirae bacterium]|nr:LysM peptidoglycan-binding domain-containing protein [Nitrospirota bacterium]
KGEDVKKIAGKIGVPAYVIYDLNSWNGHKNVRPGDTIKVPPTGKYSKDLDDRVEAKRAAYKKKFAAKKVTNNKSAQKHKKVAAKKQGKSNKLAKNNI